MSDMTGVQQRAAEWRKRQPQVALSPFGILAKALEELGEVARAMVGEYEERDGRGDVADEIAQTMIVLASLVGMHYPHRDVFADMLKEMERMGA